METIKEGCIAPNFKLMNQDTKNITLNKFKDKKNILIYFYPKAMTPGCTTQSRELSKIKEELASLNTIVLGISPDDPTRLKKFENRDNLSFNLLSDPTHEVAISYGVWGEKKFMGKTYNGIHRISFFVDINGKINKVFKKFKTKDHHQIILNYIKEYSD